MKKKAKKQKKWSKGRHEQLKLNELRRGGSVVEIKPLGEDWRSFYNRISTTAYQRAKASERRYRITSCQSTGLITVKRVK